MISGVWVRVGCAMSLIGVCGPAGPPARRPPARSGPVVEGERGAEVQFEPVDLQVVLQVRGSRAGELRHGDLVQSGDRIQLVIRTREDSHIYLAYCSTNGGLAWFPDKGSIVAKADVPVMAPAARASIVMDDNPGPESLYVLISQRELSIADQELSGLLESSRGGVASKDCERPFVGQRRVTSRRPVPGRKQARASGAAVDARASGAGAQGPSAAQEDPPPPIVELIRGGFIAWEDPQQLVARVDASGIAILRYAFTHVARAR